MSSAQILLAGFLFLLPLTTFSLSLQGVEFRGASETFSVVKIWLQQCRSNEFPSVSDIDHWKTGGWLYVWPPGVLYQNFVTKEFSDMFEVALWQRIVLRVVHTEQFVRSAVIAIGALGRHLKTSHLSHEEVYGWDTL